jgi:prepilin peptidase CpaA
MNITLPLPVAVILVAALIATATDLRAFKIHNALTLPLLLSGLVYHAAVERGAGLQGSVMGMLFGFALLFPFYLMGGMGGGDVKLMAGVGAWLGVPSTFCVFVVTAAVAGVYALVLILVTGSGRETWTNLKIIWLRVAAVGRHLGGEDRVEAEARRPDRRRRLVPFAAMMTLGIVGALLWAWVAGRA